MSLWTPGGEHPTGPRGGEGQGAGSAGPAGESIEDLSPEDQAKVRAMQQEMAEVRQQLLEAPATVVIANHAMGIYELAAIHLTAETPKLADAVLAIDALAALVDGLEGRLGEPEPTLREALAQLRAAYLEVKSRRTHVEGPDEA